MGRGDRSTVRWKHDRTRRSKARDARMRAAKAQKRRESAQAHEPSGATA
jgi:hypothetical protein